MFRVSRLLCDKCSARQYCPVKWAALTVIARGAAGPIMVEPRTELTRESFDLLLQALDADPQAGAERYDHLRRALIRFFQWRQSIQADKDADETIDRLARKLFDGKRIDDIYSYAVGVARNVYLESRRSQEKERSAFAASAALLSEPRHDDEFNLRLDCFESCLRQLPSEKRKLILAYYEGDKQTKIANRRRLADEASMPIARLRIQAHRIRRQLEICIEQCMTKKNDRP